jgi:geranylgeranylglycerol-phosphate geranylgeranyltransferase
MVKIVPYIELVRPINAAMTSVAVALGFWIGGSSLNAPSLLLLIAAAGCAVGFGNAVNDIADVEGDRINHPERPLPRGAVTVREASLYATLLALAGCLFAAMVSAAHLLATAIPLLLLLTYARYLKATPFAGNILVSLLVAYPLIYGGLGAPFAEHLVLPALLAFLLNFCREIVKDIQDLEGDRATGARTTAGIGIRPLITILIALGLVYLAPLWFPHALGHFGWVYLVVCATLVVPLHATWLVILLAVRTEHRWRAVSMTLKVEMLSGLAALAADRLLLPPYR